MTQLEPLLDVREMCDLLGIDRRTLYRLIASGQIASLLVGGSRRFRAGTVRAYLAEQEAASVRRAVRTTAVPRRRPRRRTPIAS